MILDVKWQYALKIYGWLGLGLFTGALILILFCNCVSLRDLGERRTWYGDDRGHDN